jgi:tetratricopeptide (TPR) repeat protein
MGTTPGDIKSIFGKAMQLPPAAERAAYLDEACGGDARLRAEVDALLQAHRDAGSFLKDRSSLPAVTVDEATGEQPGTVIGPYKLLEHIGEGGFGVVFMAEQQEPIRRKVALKVLKPGMDTRQVIARFEAERQALALMDHPNIAKVLDAGQTSSGRPYFVMDLVKGLPVTDYCDQAQLTPRERLELFAHVCQAVQHAHQKGIIHRDIKPTNVLVTLQDCAPLVKVIDFGIAKALGQQLTDKTLFTGFAQLVGTPLYMSPEQAARSNVDVDTRSDIYSLGVVLYELLTGTTPFEKERLREAGYDEIRRIIREEEPPRPSTRISTLAQAATTIATERKSDPKRLSQLLRGELDWIVMKALEKDRNRRYETANGFAMDVQRYLADEPVHACPPSAWYRFRKFARRNRTAIAVAACLVLVFTSLAGSIGWAVRDRVARETALDEAVDRAEEEARTLLTDSRWPEAQAVIWRAEALLESAGRHALPARLRELQQDVAMVQRLEDIYLQTGRNQLLAYPGQDMTYVHAFQDQFLTDQDQDLAYAQAFQDYGIDVAVLPVEEAAERIRERNIHAELAWALDFLWAGTRKRRRASPDWKHLLELAKKADPDPWRNRLRDTLARDDRKGLEALAQSADVRQLPPATLHLLGSTLSDMGSPDQAAALMQRAQRQYPRHLWINYVLGFSCTRALNRPQYEAGLAGYTAALAARPHSAALWSERAYAFYRLRQWDDAIADFTKAIELDPTNARAWANRAATYAKLGQWDRVLADSSKAIELDPKYAAAWNNRGTAYASLGQPEKALADSSRAVELEPSVAQNWLTRAAVYKTLGQWEKALGQYSKGIELDAMKGLIQRGQAYAESGRPNEAIVDFSAAIKLDPKYAEAWCHRGTVYGQLGQVDKAIGDLSKAIALEADYAAWVNRGITYTRLRKWDQALVDLSKATELDPKQATGWQALGDALRGQGKLADAEAAYRQAIRLKPEYANAHSSLGVLLCDDKRDYAGAIIAFRKAIRLKPDEASYRFNLGNALQGHGKLGEAQAAYRQAIRLKPDCAEAHNNLGSLLCDHKRDYAGAVIAFREAIRLKPDEALYHFNLGNALWRQGKLGEAEGAYREAICLKPDFAQAHYFLGMALRGQGKVAEAEAAFRAAIRLKPDYAPAYCDLGALLCDHRRDYAGAVIAFREAIRIKPDYALAHNALGCALEKRAKVREALAEYQVAIRLDADCARFHNNLAWLLATCVDPTFRNGQQAVESAKKAVKLAPTVGDWWGTLGVAQYRAGDWKAAIEAFGKAMEIKKALNHRECFFLAMTLWRLGEKEKARQWYGKAVEWMDKNDPKNQELRRFRAEAADLLGIREEKTRHEDTNETAKKN